ncbi:hypothetical protein [Haladaptatus sp. DJG-WS-42]|uniref:hypothetical protein n=1 Tax=Haladaptatus sp. DJG-WS-42 TaxID=3120516 RepID=UPI0030D48841
MDTVAVRRFLLDTHGETIAETLQCADAVSKAWDGETVTDRAQVVKPLRALLTKRGVLERYPTMLAEAVEAGGERMQASPVAAPPYVIVTSTGPVLRATLPGGRLVIRIEAFAVARHALPSYSRTKASSDDALSVDYR